MHYKKLIEARIYRPELYLIHIWVKVKRMSYNVPHQ